MVRETLFRLALACCLLMTTPAFLCPASAEATETVRKLMQAPVSMFDWGIHRLEHQLNSCLRIYTGEPWTTQVHYDLDTNRILVRVMHVAYEPSDEASAKQWCSLLLDQTKECLGVDKNTGRPKSESATFVQQLFSHCGYQMPGEQNDLGIELDAIVWIEAVAPSGSADPAYVCYEGSLIGTKKLYREIATHDGLFK